MAKTDDGHYEVILGNRQLVSGFFVLIIFFAIFLTLGYVLGRNSVVVDDRSTTAQRQELHAADTRDGSVAANRTSAAPPIGRDDRPSPSSAETSTPVAPQPSSQAEASSPEPRATTSTAPAAPESTAPQVSTAPPPAVPTKAQEVLDAKVRVITPRKGDSFVQVAAVGRVEAELMAEQLQKRGYRTFISEVPGRDLFRVLIGPFESQSGLTDTKNRLKSEGIETIIQRY